MRFGQRSEWREGADCENVGGGRLPAKESTCRGPAVGVCVACPVNRGQCGWRPVRKGEHNRQMAR